MKQVPLGVLVSGNGTNLQALIDASQTPGFPATVGLVISNVPGAFALERARQRGIPTVVLEPRASPNKTAYEEALVKVLADHRITHVCLAGFMRILGPTFLRAFPNGVLNIHPSLLPAFPGLHAHRQALAHGVRVSGCTVHFVDEGTDTGPIAAQAAVPVLEGDDETALAARILAEEHKLYPSVVQLWTTGQLQIEGRRVVTRPRASPAIAP